MTQLRKTNIMILSISFLFLTACGSDYVSPFERQVDASTSTRSVEDNNEISDSLTTTPEDSQESIIAPPVEEVLAEDPAPSLPQKISLYDKVLQNSDIKEEALFNAFEYFDENHKDIDNQDWITIFDIGMHSGKKRFYMINMETGDVKKYHTAHGKNSDTDHDGYATTFSNTNGSNQSSLGFMLAAETYNGKWGYSMRLDGLESQNSNVRKRAIVVHGADYVNPNWSKMGRSLGCPALPLGDKDWIIQQINGGSLFYTYHEDHS